DRNATPPRQRRPGRGNAAPLPAELCGSDSRTWSNRGSSWPPRAPEPGRSEWPRKWPTSGHKCSASTNTGTSLMRIQTRSVNEMSKDEHGMMNADDEKELLEAVSEKIRALLHSVTDAIYGNDESAKF